MKREKRKRTRVALFLFLFPRRLLSSPLTLIYFFFCFFIVLLLYFVCLVNVVSLVLVDIHHASRRGCRRFWPVIDNATWLFTGKAEISLYSPLMERRR